MAACYGLPSTLLLLVSLFGIQVLSELKAYMVEEWRSASSSFLLDETSLPLPTSEIVAELDDRVRITCISCS
jgi:hypothetical protein